jgi:hypothetical protein
LVPMSVHWRPRSPRSVVALGSLALALASVLPSIALPSVALAHGDSGGAQLPKDAPAVTKDGEEAKAIFKKIEGDPPSLAIVKDTVDKGEKAIARAQGAKLSGDDEGAQLLSRLALGLAKTADATLRAATAEKKASDRETEAVATAEQVTRMKTLLAETQAHASQVAAELAKAQDDAKGAAGGAAKKEEDRLKKDAKKAAGKGAAKDAKAPKDNPPAPSRDAPAKDPAKQDAAKGGSKP